MTEPHDRLWIEWFDAWQEADASKPKPSYEGWLEERLEAAENLNELAWGIIANAGGGDWSTQTQLWQDAAVRWRERWFAALAGRKP